MQRRLNHDNPQPRPSPARSLRVIHLVCCRCDYTGAAVSALTARENAKHFPDDPVWQRHCEKLAAHYNAMEKTMNHLSPWDRRNSATPKDTFHDDLNAACRKHFEALKGDYEAICYRAGVDIKPDIEAYALFCDGVDNAFDIDWRMTRED